MRQVQKGSIVMPDGWWYVVVEQHGEDLFCICDNANNIYSHKVSECKHIATPYEAMMAHAWSNGDDDLKELFVERPCPVDVIAEVLAGCHDDRFNHWSRSAHAEQEE